MFDRHFSQPEISISSKGNGDITSAYRFNSSGNIRAWLVWSLNLFLESAISALSLLDRLKSSLSNICDQKDCMCAHKLCAILLIKTMNPESVV